MYEFPIQNFLLVSIWRKIFKSQKAIEGFCLALFLIYMAPYFDDVIRYLVRRNRKK